MRIWIPLIGFGLFLLLAVVIAARLWFGLAEVEISAAGWLALVLGTVLSLGLGGGLMALVFYSNRHGHDEAAGSSEDVQPLWHSKE
jgi:hypothetical protein